MRLSPRTIETVTSDHKLDLKSSSYKVTTLLDYGPSPSDPYGEYVRMRVSAVTMYGTTLHQTGGIRLQLNSTHTGELLRLKRYLIHSLSSTLNVDTLGFQL